MNISKNGRYYVYLLTAVGVISYIAIIVGYLVIFLHLADNKNSESYMIFSELTSSIILSGIVLTSIIGFFLWLSFNLKSAQTEGKKIHSGGKIIDLERNYKYKEINLFRLRVILLSQDKNRIIILPKNFLDGKIFKVTSTKLI